MKKVLFVCTGNTCRSPMAEALFMHRYGAGVEEWTACSAGIYASTGSPASRPALEVMEELGLDISQHRSRPLNKALLNGSDLIVTMTAAQRFDLLRDYPEVGRRVFLIKSFGTSKVPADITDPFGDSVNVYRKTRDEIDRALADLILFIHAQNSK